jgi:hypothetical protein
MSLSECAAITGQRLAVSQRGDCYQPQPVDLSQPAVMIAEMVPPMGGECQCDSLRLADMYNGRGRIASS